MFPFTMGLPDLVARLFNLETLEVEHHELLLLPLGRFFFATGEERSLTYHLPRPID